MHKKDPPVSSLVFRMNHTALIPCIALAAGNPGKNAGEEIYLFQNMTLNVCNRFLMAKEFQGDIVRISPNEVLPIRSTLASTIGVD